MSSSCFSKLECRCNGWPPEIAAPNPCYERLKYVQNVLKIASDLTTFLSAGLLGIQYFTGNDFFAAGVLLAVLGGVADNTGVGSASEDPLYFL